MADNARKMQQLARRFTLMRPWLEQACQASVEVSRHILPSGPVVSVRAQWGKGPDERSHTKVFGLETLRERVACTKDLGRRFIREVLQARGAVD